MSIVIIFSCINFELISINRCSYPGKFLGKGVLKICSKLTGQHPCPSAISIKLLCNFIEIAFRHGFSPINLLHIFRTPFLKNTSGGLLLNRTENFKKQRSTQKIHVITD